MNHEQTRLWQKIESHALDEPGARVPFSAKLAKENGWSRDFTARAIAEYRKFVFLGVAAGHSVSPPEAVDQVWHLHLTYSLDYWKRFCPHALGKPFHHVPSTGAAGDPEKFDDWYAMTLESYRRLFGKEPPPDIWPSPAERAAVKQDFVRVDRRGHWILKKPELKPEHGIALVALLVAGGCAAVGPLDWAGPQFLAFLFALNVACFALAGWVRTLLRGPATGLPMTDIDPYHAAYLAGGTGAAVTAALVNLVTSGLARISGTPPKLGMDGPAPNGLAPLESELAQAAQGAKPVAVASLMRGRGAAIGAIHASLCSSGMALSASQRSRARLVPWLIALFPLGVAMAKLLIGIERDRPVGFLIAMACVFGLTSLIFLFVRTETTRYGDATLADLRRRHSGLQSLRSAHGTVPQEDWLWGVGLFGTGVLIGTGFAPLAPQLRQADRTAASGSSSCSSSSCGGSGDGGGGGCGGGCGGCGGGD